MILPSRAQAPSRRKLDRARPGEPDFSSIVVGIGAFLLVAAACLYLVAHLAP